VKAPAVETAVRQQPVTIEHEYGSIGIHEDRAVTRWRKSP